jgi:hypothetical protein
LTIGEASGQVFSYLVCVDYRTSSGCNKRNVYVNAPSWDEAFDEACAKVRKRPGVIKVDGGKLLGRPVPVSGPMGG